MDSEGQAEIGGIANYYGGVTVKWSHPKGKAPVYEWGIQNWDGLYGWEEIPDYLFQALMTYQEEYHEGWNRGVVYE